MSDTAGEVGGRVNYPTALITTADIPEPERFDFWRDIFCNGIFGIDCHSTWEQPFFGEIAITRTKDARFSVMHHRGFKCLRTPQWIRDDKEDDIFIPLVLRGTLLVTQDGREATLGPGDFACFDSRRPHLGITSDEVEQIVLHIPREAWIRRIGSTEQVTARVMRGNTPMGALVSNFLRQVIPCMGTIDSATADRLTEVSLSLVTTAFGNLILQQCECQSSVQLSLLYRAKSLIDERLADPSLNPEKLANDLGISERYLQKLFRKERTTISNWIWQRRLERCRQDLSNPLLTGRSVSQIAFSYGFNDLSHFSHRFKAEFSITPSDFRREQIAGNSHALIGFRPAVVESNDRAIIIDTGVCGGCGRCVEVCPQSKLKLAVKIVNGYKKAVAAVIGTFRKGSSRKEPMYSCATCQPVGKQGDFPCVSICERKAITVHGSDWHPHADP